MSTRQQREGLVQVIRQAMEQPTFYETDLVAVLFEALGPRLGYAVAVELKEYIRRTRPERSWRFYSLACEACGKGFSAHRDDARTCSPTCRQRLSRKERLRDRASVTDPLSHLGRDRDEGSVT